jgi:hypothetical protein
MTQINISTFLAAEVRDSSTSQAKTRVAIR